MYVRRVQLTDLRGFPKLDFRFEQPNEKYAGWVVITGDNASGKTALLRAIALCLVGPDVARPLQPSLEGWVRHNASHATMAVEVERDPIADAYVEPGRTTGRFWAELEITNGAGARTSAPLLQDLAQRGPLLARRRGPWAPNAAGWFCAGYGPFRRLYGASEDAAGLARTPGPTGRFVTLFHEAATLQEAERWLKDLDHRRKSGNSEATRVLEVVERLLNAEFLHQGLRVERIDADGLWLCDTADVVLPMRDMSDGYRAAVALLADILRHMIGTYGPDDLLQEQGGRVSVQRPGVVLVDEIDVHLHPEWQRNIGFWLKDHLPNVQFIVATHSPLICQAADERMIFHLPPPGSDLAPFPLQEQDYWRIVRSKPDEILLTPAFGLKHTRSPLAVAQRRTYTRLSAKRDAVGLTEAEEGQLKLALSFVDDEEDA